MPEPQLSVVICTLGEGRVAETVESVAESARVAEAAVETIVVWQGAEPGPELDGAVVQNVFPSGLAYARNRGLVAAQGELVGFVDDDEVVDPAWARGLLDAFSRAEAAAGVFGPIAPRDARGLPYCRYDGGGSFRLIRAGTPPWRVGSGGNMVFRREALLAVGGFDPLFGAGSVSRSAEETELIQRLLESGRTLAWSPDPVVYHPTKTEAERLRSRYPYAFGLGKVVRRYRSPVLAARYGSEIARTLASGGRARDGRRLREARATLHGFASAVAFRASASSPHALLERAPGAVAAALDGAAIEPREPSFRPDPHFVYRVAGDRILHVYVNPSARFGTALAVRERLARPGIPQVIAQAADVDAWWVLEELLTGQPPQPDRVADWFPRVAEWVLGLGPGTGIAVREGSWWADESPRALAAAPGSLRAAVESALDAVGVLLAQPLHGDVQRKNILLGESVGVIDWEDPYEDGPPGLDLLFLAAMVRGDVPDTELLRDLARGRDPAWSPLRELLRRAGVGDDLLRPLLLAALAVWAANEAARAGLPGLPRAEPMYGRLLSELGPELAS
ncbi:MAG TPA: glycosyltransferase [Gaiellaceae bacterium]|nr:glycosyltransferase [Gaiellaceae bacterium]